MGPSKGGDPEFSELKWVPVKEMSRYDLYDRAEERVLAALSKSTREERVDSSPAVRGILGAVSRPEWIEDPQELKKLAAFKDGTKLVAIVMSGVERIRPPSAG